MILNGSKDMMCWKMYNFLGHPVYVDALTALLSDEQIKLYFFMSRIS